MSRSRRGDSGLSFVFAVNKPTDFTSHDVVNAVRRATGERRVGHGGTLDPFATGVLPIMVGPATRLSSYFDLCQKEYVAKIEFGKATDTDDLTGNVIMTKGVSKGARHRLYRQDFAKEVLANFIGEIEQVPPKYSAIKVGGKKSYEVARGGGELEIPKRRVKVFEAKLLNIEENEAKDAPVWEVRFVVGSGTYIRSIARDAGLLADSCAFVSSLKRTRVGGLSLNCSVELDDLSSQENWIDNWNSLAVDPAQILSLAPIVIDAKEAKLVSCGNAISAKDRDFDFELDGDKPVLIATDEKILAVYKYDAKSEKLKADTVFAKGILR